MFHVKFIILINCAKQIKIKNKRLKAPWYSNTERTDQMPRVVETKTKLQEQETDLA